MFAETASVSNQPSFCCGSSALSRFYDLVLLSCMKRSHGTGNLKMFLSAILHT